jgi:diamine N-acetyltransferase
MIGDRVALRAVEMSDADWIYQWENDPEVWQVSNTLAPFSRYIIEQYILNSTQDIFAAKQLRLMIDLKKEESWIPVGSIDLFEFDPLHRRAGVGILVCGEYRGQGIASEALQLLRSYAFDTLQLHQLFCHISSNNDASLALFQKNGFVITGTRKDWMLNKGAWVDEFILQCMNPEDQE